ncbi:MAG: arginine--tRNA ligase [Fuerstiella sp.]|nr:arginine--tRNA ligase [Fuerstiella sp.]
MNILHLIRSRFHRPLSGLTDDVAPLLDMIRPSQDPKFGDYQANCAMPLKKVLNKPPREIAEQLISEVDLSDLCESPKIAGPGFINLRLRDDWIASGIESVRGDDRLGCAPVTDPRHVVVDFSSPNVAKPMHVGHLRSSVIGDAIARILRFAGHNVTTDNHIGDWGTQFGMIIYGYRHFSDSAAYAKDPVAELARLYRLVNQLTDFHKAKLQLPGLLEQRTTEQTRLHQAESSENPKDKKHKKLLKGIRKQIADLSEQINSSENKLAAVKQSENLQLQANAHPEIARLSRQETSKLHAGDPDNQVLWDEFLPACLQALNHVYDRLDITFDLELGESAYNAQLGPVVQSLKELNLAVDSDGATCVFVEGNTAPFIVQKTDGAYTYATTDLATIEYRVSKLDADEILYVVDKRQEEHFQLLFKTAALWKYPDPSYRHVSFGTVMGKDNKPYKTRSGDVIGLESLLDEAVHRARRIVDENDERREEPLLSDSERSRVADIVGLGGIKYADLHHNRDSDYIFDWDKMLATSGDTATYMQYAYARICGIFRKLDVNRESLSSSSDAVLLTVPEERALALQLLRFGEAVDDVLSDYRPHLMTAWLLETSGCLSKFYSTCSVQGAETPALQRSRLILCDLVARGIRTGLSLLGIKTADVM